MKISQIMGLVIYLIPMVCVGVEDDSDYDGIPDNQDHRPYACDLPFVSVYAVDTAYGIRTKVESEEEVKYTVTSDITKTNTFLDKSTNWYENRITNSTKRSLSATLAADIHVGKAISAKLSQKNTYGRSRDVVSVEYSKELEESITKHDIVTKHTFDAFKKHKITSEGSDGFVGTTIVAENYSMFPIEITAVDILMDGYDPSFERRYRQPLFSGLVRNKTQMSTTPGIRQEAEFFEKRQLTNIPVAEMGRDGSRQRFGLEFPGKANSLIMDLSSNGYIAETSIRDFTIRYSNPWMDGPKEIRAKDLGAQVEAAISNTIGILVVDEKGRVVRHQLASTINGQNLTLAKAFELLSGKLIIGEQFGRSWIKSAFGMESDFLYFPYVYELTSEELGDGTWIFLKDGRNGAKSELVELELDMVLEPGDQYTLEFVTKGEIRNAVLFEDSYRAVICDHCAELSDKKELVWNGLVPYEAVDITQASKIAEFPADGQSKVWCLNKDGAMDVRAGDRIILRNKGVRRGVVQGRVEGKEAARELSPFVVEKVTGKFTGDDGVTDHLHNNAGPVRYYADTHSSVLEASVDFFSVGYSVVGPFTEAKSMSYGTDRVGVGFLEATIPVGANDVCLKFDRILDDVDVGWELTNTGYRAPENMASTPLSLPDPIFVARDFIADHGKSTEKVAGHFKGFIIIKALKHSRLVD